MVTNIQKYIKYDITLPCSTIIFNSLIANARRYTKNMLEFSFYHCYFLTNIESKHVTSTYHPSWYLVFEFTYNVTYFHRVINI